MDLSKARLAKAMNTSLQKQCKNKTLDPTQKRFNWPVYLQSFWSHSTAGEPKLQTENFLPTSSIREFFFSFCEKTVFNPRALRLLRKSSERSVRISSSIERRIAITLRRVSYTPLVHYLLFAPDKTRAGRALARTAEGGRETLAAMITGGRRESRF